jgi:hypothetical protein
MLAAFVSKSMLYVYQNIKWNQRKTTPKIYQNIPLKKYICLPKVTLPIVCFHPLSTFVSNATNMLLLKKRIS